MWSAYKIRCIVVKLHNTPKSNWNELNADQHLHRSQWRKVSTFIQVLCLRTILLLPYSNISIFMPLSTSTPQHFRWKYCTLYSTAFIRQLWLLVRLQILIINTQLIKNKLTKIYQLIYATNTNIWCIVV